MALAQTVYQTVFKRNSVFVGTVFFGAFAFGIGFDTVSQKLWDSHNRGKQWKDIRDKITSN
ncbi:putative QCR9-ubiquinol--cytochrome-c reductase subunit 9 [Tilletiopsis washingtonensis]|uniref:Complex III subunit 9 n=1 Tax=Tilletiopsis washingtonensis TaxID=58919 RepID=A0A316Z936_9BASI|nr:putative QCR9-ubiquinol--cytochrome-c reductase subunit 9 [Tilletiopsis washingtonensis]PWN98091.1 putative QCR9-ubiquinol--cytochrome-c reductase subunit 9 [Tilletiopsis washingtonensis]